MVREDKILPAQQFLCGIFCDANTGQSVGAQIWWQNNATSWYSTKWILGFTLTAERTFGRLETAVRAAFVSRSHTG